MILNDIIFMGSALVAVVASIMVIASRNPVNAVLYLVMSLSALSFVIYTLGSSFLAVLEVIVYAGAIMVLFLFVVQMLNLGEIKTESDLQLPSRKDLILPMIIATLLLVITLSVLLIEPGRGPDVRIVTADELFRQLYQKHYLGVELASLVLLIGIIGGMHLGRAAHYDSESPEVKPSADR